MIYVPMMSTPAGRSLTAQQGLDTGVGVVSYALVDLLHKPGFDYLKTCDNLAKYVGWPSSFILNASMPSPLQNGRYTLQSPFDGSYQRYTVTDILELIQQLKPERVILPQGFYSEDPEAWLSLPEKTFPFFPHTDSPHDLTQRLFGLSLVAPCDPSSIAKNIPLHIMQSVEQSCVDLSLWAAHNLQYVETNKPAQDACDGVVYMSTGTYDLTDYKYAEDFNLLDETCHCATCTTLLTRAYLHHLFEHTPLLCQRFLIQHNVHVTINAVDLLQRMPFTTA